MSSPHLDDDALSATLDGESTPDERAHVDGCPECRARLDQLAAAANAIGAPVGAVDPDRREQAIAAALAHQPVRLADRRRRQVPGWLLAAAAAIIAVGALVPLLRDGDGGSADREATASKAAPAPEAAQDSAAGGDANATLFAAAPPVVAGDLGVVPADGSLADVVRPALGTANDRQVSSTTTAPSAAATTGPPCVEQLTAAEPVGALRLQATATVDGIATAVLVFDLPGDPPRLRAFAVDPADCRVVRSETFPG